MYYRCLGPQFAASPVLVSLVAAVRSDTLLLASCEGRDNPCNPGLSRSSGIITQPGFAVTLKLSDVTVPRTLDKDVTGRNRHLDHTAKTRP